MWGTRYTKLLILCLATACWACSPAPEGSGSGAGLVERVASPQVADQEFLQAAEFTNAVEVRANLYNLFWNGQVRAEPEKRAAVFHWKNGNLTAQPNTENAPWYIIAPTRGSLDQFRYTGPVGRREIVSRSDQRRWTEDATEYFAETVNYVVRFDDQVSAVPGRTVGPFELRIVAVNDPRAGEWHLSSFDYKDNAERQTLAALVDSVGAASSGELVDAVRTAIEQANVLIEQNLAESGVIARTADPNVLTSRQARLNYFIGMPNVGELATAARAATSRAAQICQQLNVQGYGSWRLPRLNELQAVTVTVRGQTTWRRLADAPDGRLWREYSQVQEQNNLRAPTSDPPPYESYAPTHFRFAHSGQVTGENGGSGFISGRRDTGAVMCVADIPPS